MIRACSDCGGRGIAWYLLIDDHALDWGDDCFPWGESALRLCRTCGGRGVVGAEELEAERDRLRAELAERHSDLEALLAVTVTDHCPCCGEPWGDSFGPASNCPFWAGNIGIDRCEGGTAMACCECLCGEGER